MKQKSFKLTMSLALLLMSAGCGGGSRNSSAVDGASDAVGFDAALPDASLVSEIGAMAAEPQRDGDPQKGYLALIENGYVGCGIPYSAFSLAVGPAPQSLRLPERTGHNAEMAYNYTAFTTKSGVEVVTPNCLQCHAEVLDGKVVIGLGSISADYTIDFAAYANLSGMLVTDPKEKKEWQKWAGRMTTIAPYIRTKTVGVNPADNLAAVLFAHRDAESLAWSEEPLLELPKAEAYPVDVPPWWRMRKKNAMFYNSAGRGDHARIMMTASTLCVDSVAEAQEIDSYFPDVRSYILSLEPPPYTRPIDEQLASDGQAIFTTQCASCHGTYGAEETYPNLVIALDEVGTDPSMAGNSSQFEARFVGWFNRSFFGKKARLAPAPGYVAPPLDGIWVTAPFLHNGSVPTLRALLDSTLRPTYWKRTAGEFLENDVGWAYEELATGQAEESNSGKRVQIYDTTFPGYGNQGHTFGDALSDAERTALIEYLKTI